MALVALGAGADVANASVVSKVAGAGGATIAEVRGERRGDTIELKAIPPGVNPSALAAAVVLSDGTVQAVPVQVGADGPYVPTPASAGGAATVVSARVDVPSGKNKVWANPIVDPKHVTVRGTAASQDGRRGCRITAPASPIFPERLRGVEYATRVVASDPTTCSVTFEVGQVANSVPEPRIPDSVLDGPTASGARASRAASEPTATRAAAYPQKRIQVYTRLEDRPNIDLAAVKTNITWSYSGTAVHNPWSWNNYPDNFPTTGWSSWYDVVRWTDSNANRIGASVSATWRNTTGGIRALCGSDLYFRIYSNGAWMYPNGAWAAMSNQYFLTTHCGGLLTVTRSSRVL